MIDLSPLHDWIIWVLAGLVLLIAEMLLPGVFLMWIGLACLGAGLAAFALPLGFAGQVVVFVVLAAITLTIGLRLRRRPSRLNTATSGLAGRSAVALVFHGREGRVRVGDSDWAARLPIGVAEPDPGTRLLVEGVDGTVLIVRPSD
jgi:membrane protein implicated in regulation of membrane protease activity